MLDFNNCGKGRVWLLIYSITLVFINVVRSESVEFIEDRIKHTEDSIPCLTKTNEDGICINLQSKLRKCPPLYKLLKTKDFQGLKRALCQDSADTRQVCCPLTSYNETVETAVDHSGHKRFKLFPPSCGQTFSSNRIIGGITAKPGDNPWMARLGFSNDNGTNVIYACGGTLINKRYILTAAHCFKELSFKLHDVQLAETDENVENECIEYTSLDQKTQIIECSKSLNFGFEEIVIHPHYNRDVIGTGDDIALVRLDRDVNLTSYFTRPICLPFVKEYNLKTNLEQSPNYKTLEAFVAGWGKTTNNENIGSTTLQYVKVPLTSPAVCRSIFKDVNVGANQMCAGGQKGQDSCQGDSGGPLTMTGSPAKMSARTFQVGIVSFGRSDCGEGEAPVVYTKVRKYLKWILDSVRE